MRRLIVLPLLLLAGCWMGGPFYAASESVMALPPGRYRMVAPDESEPEKTVLVSRREGGMTRVHAEGDEPVIAGFAPLGTEGGSFVAWSDLEKGEGESEAMQAFWLLRSRGGEFRLYYPVCEGEAAAVAAAAGALVERDVKMPGCRFADRQSLEKALLTLRPREEEMVRVIPLP